MAGGRNGGALPSLPWADDNNAAVWKLVSLLEEPENRHRIFGRDPSEVKSIYSILTMILNLFRLQNTTGDSKSKVNGVIAKSIWPDFYERHPKVVTSGKKTKAES